MILIFKFLDSSKDPIARKMRLRRRRDQEEADQDQAKILKVKFSFWKIKKQTQLLFIL